MGKKGLAIGLTLAAVFCAAAGSAAVGIGFARGNGGATPRQAAALSRAQADGMAMAAEEAGSRPDKLQAQIDGLSAKVGSLLSELGGRPKDGADQDGVARIKSAVSKLKARTRDQAEALAETERQIRDEVKKVRQETLAVRAELDGVSEALTRFRSEVAALRSDVAVAGQALHTRERCDQVAAKPAPSNCFERLVNVTNEKVIGVAVQGFESLRRGNPAAALEAFRTAHTWDRHSPEILYGMALAHVQRGDTAAAEQAVWQAIQAEHARPTLQPWFRHVMVSMQGQCRLAVEAIKADPTLAYRMARGARP